MANSSYNQSGAGVSPAVSDAAIQAVAANAARHLLEADQHYKAKRFSSATASAVLSIEEAGKLLHIIIHGVAPKRNRHASHAAFFIGLLKVVGSWRWSVEWTKFLQGTVGFADIELTDQQQMDVAEHPELEQFLRRLQAGELADSAERVRAWAEAVTAKEKRDGTYKTWERLFSRGLQETRLYATYVNVSDSGDLARDPRAIDNDFAKFICTGAVAFLFLTLLIAAHHRKCIVLRDLLKEFPEELTGWVALKYALIETFPALASIPFLEALVAQIDEVIRVT